MSQDSPIKLGDRVKLTEAAALLRMRRRKQARYFNWRTRQGIILHIRKDPRIVEVQWEGRTTAEPWPLHTLEPIE